VTGSADEEFKKKIGNFNIPTNIPGVTVHVPVYFVIKGSATATVEIATGFEEKIGVRYNDRNGISVYPEKKEDRFDGHFDILTQAHLEASAGLNLPINLAAA
jgi:hypothetical protein